jgi:hypothetical protein
MNNWPAPVVYLLCQYEHHPADYGYFVGWDIMYILIKVWANPSLSLFSGLAYVWPS